MTSKEPIEVLANHYRAMEHYLHTLPCGCAEQATTSTGGFGTTPTVHPTIHELLKSTLPGVKLNHLDVRRRKKLLHNIESLKSWISKEIDFDQSRQYEIIKELQKIARALRQMALDVSERTKERERRVRLSMCSFQAQPSLPDIFLWMICDSKRVAYARLSPEDLLFNLCEGEKGCHNGRVQTLFLKVRLFVLDDNRSIDKFFSRHRERPINLSKRPAMPKCKSSSGWALKNTNRICSNNCRGDSRFPRYP